MKKLIFPLLLCTFGALFSNAQTFVEIQKVVAEDRESEDRAGWSVDIDGNYAVVGAYGDDFGEFDPNMGSVYVYERDIEGDWNFVQKLTNSDQDDYDRFGWSVAIHDDIIVIGAYGEDEDENDENNLSKAGSAYIFQRDGDGTWNEIQKIVASDRAEGDEFGFSVAVHDDLIAVGAHYCSTNEDGFSFSLHAGATYIFEENDAGEWIELQKLVASDRWGNPGVDYEEEDWNWRFGESVGVYEDYVVVGSQFAAKAYVYERTGDTWSEANKLTYPGISWLDRAGIVSIDQTTIVIGAQTWDYTEVYGEDHLLNAGGAAVFDRNMETGEWEYTEMIVNEDRDAGDHFGIDVAIEGEYIVVGTHSDNHDEEDGAYLENAGSAYVFKRIAGDWQEYDKVDASDRNEEDEHGIAVSISGITAIVGAFQQDFTADGGAYVEDGGAGYFYEDADDEACPTVYFDQTISICDGESIMVGLSEYSETGTYEDVLVTVDGCDSIVTTELSVLGGEPYTYSETICPGQTVVVGDSEYTEAGTYTDIFETELGCDSIVETTVILEGGVDDYEVEGGADGLYVVIDGLTTYQWMTCDPYEIIPGEEDWFFYPPGPGQYAVIVQNEDGCIDTSDCVTIEGIADELTMPSVGIGATQEACEGTLFDSGGSLFNYANNEDGIITIAPTGATEITLTFVSFDVELGDIDCTYDFLEVYDGPTTDDDLIGVYCNSSPPPATITSTGGAITLRFQSDEIVTLEGFEIGWECTGIDDSSIDETESTNFTVYPNPSIGQFKVVLDHQTTARQMDILNELGQLVFTSTQVNQTNEVDLTAVEPGMYLIRLHLENGYSYQKIVINQ